MKRGRSLALVGLAAAAAAGADTLTSTDRYGEPYVAYAQVDRTDGTYRRMLTTPDVLEVAQTGAPLPGGIRILMETYQCQGNRGNFFHKKRLDGQ